MLAGRGKCRPGPKRQGLTLAVTTLRNVGTTTVDDVVCRLPSAYGTDPPHVAARRALPRHRARRLRPTPVPGRRRPPSVPRPPGRDDPPLPLGVPHLLPHGHALPPRRRLQPRRPLRGHAVAERRLCAALQPAPCAAVRTRVLRPLRLACDRLRRAVRGDDPVRALEPGRRRDVRRSRRVSLERRRRPDAPQEHLDEHTFDG